MIDESLDNHGINMESTAKQCLVNRKSRSEITFWIVRILWSPKGRLPAAGRVCILQRSCANYIGNLVRLQIRGMGSGDRRFSRLSWLR